jgi:hypothetical protein
MLALKGTEYQEIMLKKIEKIKEILLFPKY